MYIYLGSLILPIHLIFLLHKLIHVHAHNPGEM